MPRVDIITGNKYPNGDAGSIRQHIMAKMLTEMGYSVFVHCMGESTHQRIVENDKIQYKSYRGEKTQLPYRIMDRLFFVRRVLSCLKTEKEKPEALLVIDVGLKNFRRITRFAEENYIKLVHDSVEWYSPEEFKTGKLSMQYRSKNKVNLEAINKKWNVIAISEYLKNHFSHIANKTVCIPVIMNMRECDKEVESEAILPHTKTRFVYAGAPGKKDLLNTILQGFAQLSKDQLERIEIHIIGVSRDQLINNCSVDLNDLISLDGIIYTHGRLSHDDAERWVKNSDYSLLLRNETLRYAKAGFPTKRVESLKNGTPPVCNYSSDLKQYLTNGKNAVIIKGHTAEDVKEAIEEILNISKENYLLMRHEARVTAEKYFDYRAYMDTLKSVF